MPHARDKNSQYSISLPVRNNVRVSFKHVHLVSPVSASCLGDASRMPIVDIMSHPLRFASAPVRSCWTNPGIMSTSTQAFCVWMNNSCKWRHRFLNRQGPLHSFLHSHHPTHGITTITTTTTAAALLRQATSLPAKILCRSGTWPTVPTAD